MDVSLESKSLPSVGYSRKSYPKVTSQRLARGKLVHFHGWKSLALPSVGPDDFKTLKRAAKYFRNNKLNSQGYELASTLRLRNHFATKGDFAALCKMLPSARSDWIAMAATSSCQLRIVHRLKHWIVDFLRFEMEHQLDTNQLRHQLGMTQLFSSNMQTSQHQVSPVEQAIVNLSKVMTDFIGDQKNINIQVNQMIDHVKSFFN
ncbi:hypothetical protein CK203_102664 [Vitis vinifera]|uniref:Uncharacterized protein n=1 Tax=Vitis vinifera TaxID=29760 RepID=A0A438C666_VITVI|nr:hypothetical protein CK203_102664 [Vitis vinifera]